MHTQFSNRRHTPWLVGAVALTAAIVAGLWVGLTPVHSQTSQPLAPTAGYSVFNRLAAANDTPPTDLNEGSYISREIQTGVPSLRQWVTAEGETLCVQINVQESGSDSEPRACDTTANLDSSHQLLVLGVGGGSPSPASLSGDSKEAVSSSSAPTPPTLLAGLAPDAVTQVSVTFADGKVQTIPTQDNGFHVYTDGKMPTNLTWTTAGNVQHSQPL
jgi:hypothetical protein